MRQAYTMAFVVILPGLATCMGPFGRSRSRTGVGNDFCDMRLVFSAAYLGVVTDTYMAYCHGKCTAKSFLSIPPLCCCGGHCYFFPHPDAPA